MLEARITDNLQIEANKREAILEKLRVKALDTAAAMRSAWLSTNSWGWNTVKNELNQTNNIYDDTSAEKVIRYTNSNFSN